MDLERVREAIDDLKVLLRSGEPVEESLGQICDGYGISEDLLRHWFVKSCDKTPEEYARIKRHDVSLHNTLAAAASRWMRNRQEPDMFGRRFHLDYDAWKGRKGERRYYRYIGFSGYWVEAIDEETHEVIKFDGGPEIWAEIRKKVAAAERYDRADELKFAFDDPELTAREHILGAIRLALLGRGAGNLEAAAEAADQKIEGSDNLTVLYESLTPEMKAQVDRSVQNPSVDAHWKENGQKKSLSDLPIEQLSKIKRGEIIANPVHEKPRSWRDAQ